MKLWRPLPSPFRFVPIALAVACLPLLFWLWGLLAARVSSVTYDPGVFGLGLALSLTLMLLGTSLYLAYCMSRVSYALDRQRLVIRCGGMAQVVPLSEIDAVYQPGKLINNRLVTVKQSTLNPSLPGYVVGLGYSPELGRVLSVATVPPGGQVFLRLPQLAIGISPADAVGFATEIEARRTRLREEIEDHLRTASAGVAPRQSPLMRLGAPLWSDALLRRVGLAGLLLSALFFFYVSYIYGGLPLRVPLHWNAQAQIDRIGDPLELVRLPAFALGVWLVNVLAARWAVSRERGVALFLLLGGAAAQVVFWAGALSIVLRST